MNRLVFLAAAPLALSAPPAGAVELVTNGGFEQQDNFLSFRGWTAGGAGDGVNVSVVRRTGFFAAGFSSRNGRASTLSQTLATVAGASYTLTFWVQNLEVGQDSFQAFFGDQQVFDLPAAPLANPALFNRFSYSLVAQSASTTLSFAGFDGLSSVRLDDVSVDGPAGGVPEPAAWALMLSGFGLVGAGLRRRRTNFSAA